ncbi:hypothetical protein QR680_002571 [Steinernema hermaphroditum]|uniref:G-protein coupled receptors family 1 profile domain-containing protein n=1 Tax=Steinernema hermaphroditum TaxID=289476 RepID=A0AA39H381_9BILA|nr:hypothetical protein QR680_002571 [Steinernema hermaphroditum]
MSLNFNDAIFNYCKYYVTPEDYKNALSEELFTNKIGFVVLSVTPALSVVSLLSNISMLILVAIALYRNRLPKRSYSIACSRLVSDLLMACIIIGTGISANLHSNTNAIIVIYFVIVTFSYVSISISHLLSIIIRQVSLEPAGVYNELVQRHSLTGAVAITWTVAIGYNAAYIPIFRAILSDGDVSDVCSYRMCQRPLFLLSCIMIAVLFIIVLVFYFTVLWNLLRHNRLQKASNDSSGCRRRLIKYLSFGGHIGLYAIIATLLFIGTIFIFINVARYARVIAAIQTDCNINEFIDIRNRIHVIASGAILLWLVRMIFDPVILLATEFRALVPFLLSTDLQPLDDTESVCNTVTRSESLKWRRNLIHCSLSSKENAITAWDMKN